MSAGLSLITALIVENDRAAVRQLRNEYFTPDEVPAWNFLRDYYMRYGAIPGPAVFAENGIRLTAATGTFGYHLNWVRHRAVYDAIQANHGPLMDAMRANDVEAAVNAMHAMERAVGEVRAMEEVLGRREWSASVAERYEAALRNEVRPGITLGYEPLDRWTGGIVPGDVVALVGRPGDGKTYTISKMALDAWAAGHRTALVTMEMTDEQIATRLVGLRTGVDPAYIQRGALSGHVLPQFRQTIDELGGDDAAELFIMGGSMHKGIREIDAMVQELQPDAVYIDASYLLRPESTRNRSRHELLAEVGEGIKEMALARNIGVVHSVQFNRQAKAKSRGEHGLEMIGGTDVIGQVATIVLGIRQGATPYERTRRRISMLKNRNGPVGSIITNFLFQPIDFSLIGEDDDNTQMTEQQARQTAENMRALAESQI